MGVQHAIQIGIPGDCAGVAVKRGKRVRIPAVPSPGGPAAKQSVQKVAFCACTNEQLEAGTSCGLEECPNMAYFPRATGIDHPIPEGARVHHRAGIHTKGSPEKGGPYWGTVKQIVKPAGGRYEYDVLPDGRHAGTGRPFLTIWEEHQIDEVMEDADASE
jgi:hypothetical protein